MAKTERKPIGKKLRFEVFKRDSFTCQYCGRKAPNVLLEVDHIKPVAEGGDNSIINLVTSCRDCNRGKGKRKLSDSSTVDKQIKQLEENQEKENQLKMMIEWKEGQTDILDKQVEYFNDKLKSYTDYFFLKGFAKKLKSTLKKVGFDIVYDAFDLCADQYYDEDDKKYAENILRKIIGCSYNLYYERVDPKRASIRHIANSLKANVNYFDFGSFYRKFPDQYKIESESEFIKMTTVAKSFSNFFELVEEYYES